MAKRLANVNKDLCVSCGACTNVCPRNAISIFKGCYAVVNESSCVGCGLCSRTCPADCITMKEKQS